MSAVWYIKWNKSSHTSYSTYECWSSATAVRVHQCTNPTFLQMYECCSSAVYISTQTQASFYTYGCCSSAVHSYRNPHFIQRTGDHAMTCNSSRNRSISLSISSIVFELKENKTGKIIDSFVSKRSAPNAVLWNRLCTKLHRSSQTWSAADGK